MRDQAGAEQVVVAAVLLRGEQVLLCHRRPGRRWYPDTWDLPGGHVMEGEQPRQALARELEKELGIRATLPVQPFAHVRGADFRMDVWRVDTWAGEPGNRAPEEHDDLGWFDLDDVGRLQLADPRLPDLLAAARRLHPLRGRRPRSW